MLRPLDEALIDLEKTYRQIFKQPLYEHQQYTKRQLIYNYADVGSQFINKIINKQIQASTNKQVDLSEIIKQWNDRSVTAQQILQGNEKQKLSIQCPSSQEQDKNSLKQIEVIKKDKLISKARNQRNVNYRKELQILFRARNLNMLNVESMRNHFSDLKPYNNFHSKNKIKRFQDSNNYQQKNIYRQHDRFQRKFQEKNQQKWQNYSQRIKYEQRSKHSDEEQNFQPNYIKTSRKQSFNDRNQYSVKIDSRNQRKDYATKIKEKPSYEGYQKEQSQPSMYNSQYQFRPPAFFPLPREPYPLNSQSRESGEYLSLNDDQRQKKYRKTEQHWSHNQFYMQNRQRNSQNQRNSNQRTDYRGSYSSRNDIKSQFRNQ